MRKIPVKKPENHSILTEKKASERRIPLETGLKALISHRDILERPDIVPKSHLNLSENGLFPLKHEDLDEVEKYRLISAEFEQRYEEEREVREVKERENRELKEKILFFEGLVREVKVLKRENEKNREELEVEEGKMREIGEKHDLEVKKWEKRVEIAENTVEELKNDVKIRSENEELLKNEIKTLKSELLATKSELISAKNENLAKNAEKREEIDSISKLLSEERKNTRKIELLYAELFETHQKCTVKPEISREKDQKTAFEAQILALESRLMLEIHKKSPSPVPKLISDRENVLNDSLNIKNYLEKPPARSFSSVNSKKQSKTRVFPQKNSAEHRSKRVF